MNRILSILENDSLNSSDLKELLCANEEDSKLIYQKANNLKEKISGNKVYLRGLIEFSNQCRKNCLYCGIRHSNNEIKRYFLTDEEIIKSCVFSHQNQYGSVVLQSGEMKSIAFANRISRLLDKIHEATQGELRITLSCGEQDIKTYKNWFEHGASRYLLRIETTNRELFYKIHPNNAEHSFEERLECIRNLQETGYQTGTGVMIGLPFQTTEDLVNDLLWMRKTEIDMVGMGPYLEHKNTPLYKYKDIVIPLAERFQLTLKMIAVLRILMPDINISSATALQAIDKMGREKALKVGANVIMPNITPGEFRNNYKLYENKPCTDENPEDCLDCLEWRISLSGNKIAFGEWGDSQHY